MIGKFSLEEVLGIKDRLKSEWDGGLMTLHSVMEFSGTCHMSMYNCLKLKDVRFDTYEVVYKIYCNVVNNYTVALVADFVFNYGRDSGTYTIRLGNISSRKFRLLPIGEVYQFETCKDAFNLLQSCAL